MGNSREGLAGRSGFGRSLRTPGPLGHNKDAADPSTPFVCSASGPLGVRDHADPDTPTFRSRDAGGQILQAATLSQHEGRWSIEPLERMSPADFAAMGTAAERKAWVLRKLGRFEAQLRESAERFQVPVQLLATLVLNELVDIDWRDVLQHETKVSSGSLGIAQIQVDTALQNGLVPEDAAYRYARALGMERIFVAGRLKVPQYAIHAAAKEVRGILDRVNQNPDGAWVRRCGFVGDRCLGGQAIYSAFSSGAQEDREASLAELVIAAYNSPQILLAKDPSAGYADGRAHGENGATLARVLYKWDFFRPR